MCVASALRRPLSPEGYKTRSPRANASLRSLASFVGGAPCDNSIYLVRESRLVRGEKSSSPTRTYWRDVGLDPIISNSAGDAGRHLPGAKARAAKKPLSGGQRPRG